jgi:hypothetical protein
MRELCGSSGGLRKKLVSEYNTLNNIRVLFLVHIKYTRNTISQKMKKIKKIIKARHIKVVKSSCLVVNSILKKKDFSSTTVFSWSSKLR